MENPPCKKKKKQNKMLTSVILGFSKPMHVTLGKAQGVKYQQEIAVER